MDYSKLNGIIPVAVFDELQDCITKFKINTPFRLAHFLAQCAHESGNFTRTVENMNYSAQRLREVFPQYFNHDMATLYAHDDVAIASRVYANRMGNGSALTLEGWFYRGRGYIQLTGKDNYHAFDMTVNENIIVNPELVAIKYPLLSAAWFWNAKGCNELNDIVSITKRINGGLNGLDEREKYFDRYHTLIEL